MSSNNKIYESKADSIAAYSKYVNNHIANVHIAFADFGPAICQYLESKFTGIHDLYTAARSKILKHDDSKFSDAEFMPYIQKFYPWKGMNKTPEEVAEEFDRAWMHHAKHNDHHPEHWVQWSELKKQNISLAMDDTAIV